MLGVLGKAAGKSMFGNVVKRSLIGAAVGGVYNMSEGGDFLKGAMWGGALAGPGLSVARRLKPVSAGWTKAGLAGKGIGDVFNAGISGLSKMGLDDAGKAMKGMGWLQNPHYAGAALGGAAGFVGGGMAGHPILGAVAGAGFGAYGAKLPGKVNTGGGRTKEEFLETVARRKKGIITGGEAADIAAKKKSVAAAHAEEVARQKSLQQKGYNKPARTTPLRKRRHYTSGHRTAPVATAQNRGMEEAVNYLDARQAKKAARSKQNPQARAWRKQKQNIQRNSSPKPPNYNNGTHQSSRGGGAYWSVQTW